MAEVKLRALGLREVDFGDFDRYLTALTEDGRRIEILCKNARRGKKQNPAARHLREKLTYLGAYLGGKLAGDCYIFASDGYVCMDGLLVDEDFRHQYIAMTLMKHIAEKAQERGEILYLHADSEDTPKELYAKMGFQAVDKLYEYLCTDFSKLKI